MSTLVGSLLNGRYRLDAQIGAGGMSTVYRAFDTVLERRVAIKLMHREIAQDSDQLERFRREARAVAQLSHPHIVGVIDAGESGHQEDAQPRGQGPPYIVFEYVEGETLKDRIRRLGRLPVDEAVAYAIEIARALGAAHARGIVHRDVKPQNVLIDPEGSAKVTDFGIARSLDEVGLTAVGRVLGTTDYVSPEQALGREVNGQSDVYSLGIVLYEMLTGDVPFHGESQVAVAMKHVREQLPDVQARRPEVSASLASIVDRMTEKDLARRYPDASLLAADLEDVLAVEAARAGRATGEATAVLQTLPDEAKRKLPLRMRSRAPALALAAVLAAAAAVGGYFVFTGEFAERVERGTGQGRDPDSPPGTRVVSVRSTSARDYDPLGDRREHPEEARLAVDRDPGTTWRTEGYRAFTKAGVGIYVDAAPGATVPALEVANADPGWRATIYAARGDQPPRSVPDPGWVRVGGGTVREEEHRFRLSTGTRRFRYFLVWITSLPPETERVEISEIRLFQRRR